MTSQLGVDSTWRKILYRNHDYDDNYTDESFLKDLVVNRNTRAISYFKSFAGVTVLNYQISCITAFLIVFNLLYTEKVKPTFILLPTMLVVVFGYLVHRQSYVRQYFFEDSKTLLTVLVFGYLFAPLLHTLTAAISTDTIFALTFVMMILNLIFFDYGLDVAMVSKAVSLNAAIFGAICLASRLKTYYQAYVLLVEAFICFVLSPIFIGEKWHPFLFVLPLSFCIFWLYHLSMIVFCTYFILTLFINVCCPWAYVIKQRRKQNISGPWDEASVPQANIS